MTKKEITALLTILTAERSTEICHALRLADEAVSWDWHIYDDFLKHGNLHVYQLEIIKRYDISKPATFLALAAGLGMTEDDLRRFMEASA